MKEWVRFVLRNKRLLNFGFLFNFYSSFGQTFFISLFVPYWVASLGISNTTFGSMYATVTIISAFLISIVGKYIDQMPLKRYALLVFLGLIGSVFLLSQAYHIIILFVGLFLVRWLGQGLMTHTSSTGIAKYFDQNLGKALGFTALGHPVGQFVLPLVVIPLIAYTNWHISLVIMAIVSIILVVPSVWAISPITDFKSNAVASKISSDSEVNYFKSTRFWIIAANNFLVPFICTAVFLYQYTIGRSKGWEVTWVAFSFAFYAIFNAATLLISGHLVDKYSGVKLFPLYLLPTLLALILISTTDFKWIFPLFYALLGISSGLGSTVKTAVQVEVYGTGNLGRIRSYLGTLMVLSTALGPPLFGFLIDRQWSFNAIMGIAAILTLIIVLISFNRKALRMKNN
jgi:MFS family permease